MNADDRPDTEMETDADKRRPKEEFPRFNDPAFAPDQTSTAPSENAPVAPREDPIFAGHPEFSQDAANNDPPASGVGNSESIDDVNEKTRHSDGQNPSRMATPSPDTLKVSGAGPAIAEHSKDAKAPKSGRQPGAYVKE